MFFTGRIDKPKYQIENKALSESKENHDSRPAYITYVISFIQLAAELSKTDGNVNSKEIEHFISLFSSLSESQKKEVKSLFIEACILKNNSFIAATKIYYLFPHMKDLYKETIESLIKLALADGYLNSKEMDVLLSITQEFGLNEGHLKAYLADILNSKRQDFLKLVNLSKNANKEDAAKQLKKLIKQYHPDKFYHLPNITEEYLEYINECFKSINTAYSELKKSTF